MPQVDERLLALDQRIQSDLWRASKRYLDAGDARWMFAFAHFRITQQINETLLAKPFLYRDPNALLRFNMAFAMALLDAVRGMTTPPWKKAFAQCAFAEAARAIHSAHWPTLSDARDDAIANKDNASAVLVCAVAMANAHINTDIVNALRNVGCIDRMDYANVLVFVEQAAKDAICKLQGSVLGSTMNYLKQLMLPLDEIWRNAVYERQCGLHVPAPEESFRREIERKRYQITRILPALH